MLVLNGYIDNLTVNVTNNIAVSSHLPGGRYPMISG